MMDRPDRTIVIRAGQGTLSFLVSNNAGEAAYHPYAVKSGMSMAANLREAFKEQPYLSGGAKRAILMVPTPVVLIPSDEWQETDEMAAETIFSSVITGHKGEEKLTCEIDELNAVGIFSVNSDLRMVAGDNCDEVEVKNVVVPVWQHLYNRYYQSGQRRKLFAYFHDKLVTVCSFEQHRVRFANTFEAAHAHDALYYILFVWKQLGMSQEDDSLHVIGEMPHEQWLRGRLGTYISQIYDINPSADLNRSPLSQIEDMPFDMMLCGL